MVDDGSTDGTAEMARAKIKNLTVIRGDGNLWWAGALHKGYLRLKNAGARPDDAVLLCNDDVVFGRDYLQTAAGLLDASPEAMILSTVYTADKIFFEAGVIADLKNFTFKNAVPGDKINCATTRGLFFTVNTFLKAGGFYPLMLPHYLSDFEFTLRAHRLGIALKQEDQLKLYIDNGTTGYYNSIDNEGIAVFLKKFFSKKYPDNPIYKVIFIFMVCSFPWNLINTFRVLWTAFKHIFFHVRKLLKIK
jgi:GT2 family glycosyltransferase